MARATSGVFGVAARALGHGPQGRQGVVQFVRPLDTGAREAFFRRQPEVQWRWRRRLYLETQDKGPRYRRPGSLGSRLPAPEQSGKIGPRGARRNDLRLQSTAGWLDAVLATLDNRPAVQHVIITGRAALQVLRDAADTVSDIGMEKHAFQAGIKGDAGTGVLSIASH